uniref:Uncharacterized protein n=1 Tax=Anopheles funestus TaxID=62324 RepID=A0A182S3Y1_ANOFN
MPMTLRDRRMNKHTRPVDDTHPRWLTCFRKLKIARLVYANQPPRVHRQSLAREVYAISFRLTPTYPPLSDNDRDAGLCTVRATHIYCTVPFYTDAPKINGRK